LIRQEEQWISRAEPVKWENEREDWRRCSKDAKRGLLITTPTGYYGTRQYFDFFFIAIIN
jgi:hypothetical protein